MRLSADADSAAQNKATPLDGESKEAHPHGSPQHQQLFGASEHSKFHGIKPMNKCQRLRSVRAVAARLDNTNKLFDIFAVGCISVLGLAV